MEVVWDSRIGAAPPPLPEFRPRIAVPGRLFAGITMALRRPHKRMKIAGCRVGFFHRLLGVPLPTPLDSGTFRRNDEWGPASAKGCREWRMRGRRSGLSRIGVQDMLS